MAFCREQLRGTWRVRPESEFERAAAEAEVGAVSVTHENQ